MVLLELIFLEPPGNPLDRGRRYCRMLVCYETLALDFAQAPEVEDRDRTKLSLSTLPYKLLDYAERPGSSNFDIDLASCARWVSLHSCCYCAAAAPLSNTQSSHHS